MKYKIINLERRVTSTGKDMIKAVIQDENGNEVNDVAIWSNYPNFSALRIGDETEGNLEIVQSGRYQNKTLKAAVVGGYAPRTNKTTPITKAMETKAANIEKAQETRAEGIKLAGTARDATLLTVEWLKARQAGLVINEAAVKEKWLEYRKWLFNEFENDGSEPF